uniref:Uncharacterized protein n=1 Tax=viral metagenome TaxID=1070528 RepID=A0A6C0M298_9ZZZZ
MSTDFVKQTLRENLGRTLIPHVADGMWSIYDSAKAACDRNGQPDQVLKTFQNLLTKVPTWKDETVAKEVERISKASKCDYIDDLLLGVFISYIRAFASLQQVEKTHVDLQFTRPSVEVFIHSLYKTAARQSWSNAYLFKTLGVTSEQQARNRRDIETLINSCMNDVIDSFIPWKEISKAYFQAREEAPVSVPTPTPDAPAATPAVRFEEEEYEDEVPPITVGEELKIDLGVVDEEEEKEEAVDLNPSGSVSLNM